MFFLALVGHSSLHWTPLHNQTDWGLQSSDCDLNYFIVYIVFSYLQAGHTRLSQAGAWEQKFLCSYNLQTFILCSLNTDTGINHKWTTQHIQAVNDIHFIIHMQFLCFGRCWTFNWDKRVTKMQILAAYSGIPCVGKKAWKAQVGVRWYDREMCFLDNSVLSQRTDAAWRELGLMTGGGKLFANLSSVELDVLVILCSRAHCGRFPQLTPRILPIEALMCQTSFILPYIQGSAWSLSLNVQTF